MRRLVLVLFATPALAVVDNCARLGADCVGGAGAPPDWVVYAVTVACVVAFFNTKGPLRWMAAFGVAVFGFFSALAANVMPPEYLTHGMFALMGLAFLMWANPWQIFFRDDDDDDDQARRNRDGSR